MDVINSAPLLRQRPVQNIINCNSISVQVAGTNGKGSTCAFLSSILAAHGYKVGLYTSPHLLDICERISIGGKNIARDRFQRLAEEIDLWESGLCQSDLMFFSAVRYFNEQRVDFAIFETGMGGTRDSATLINHRYGIITEIGLDHTEYLGNTIEAITTEKAGIVKRGMEVVVYPNYTNNIIADISEKMDAHMCDLRNAIYVDTKEGFSFSIEKMAFWNVHLLMAGEFQKYNCGCALVCAKNMLGDSFCEEKAIKAVSKVAVPGRISVLRTNPLIIADVSHNPDCIKELCKYVSALKGSKCAVVAIPKNKDYKTMMEILESTFDFLIGVGIDSKSVEPDLLEADEVALDFELAIKAARGYEITAFCGSFAIAGKAFEYFNGSDSLKSKDQ